MIDEEKVSAFAEQLFGFYTGGFVTFMVDLGHRTGLFDAAGQGRATSAELAARAGLQERYVREWLGAMVTAGIVDYDPATGTYTLPAEHAVCLTGDGEMNLAAAQPGQQPPGQVHRAGGRGLPRGRRRALLGLSAPSSPT